ncbi:hypothetical protein K458DRAFT_415188, partial [Lentithecium fluviatile CBS 122367]
MVPTFPIPIAIFSDEDGRGMHVCQSYPMPKQYRCTPKTTESPSWPTIRNFFALSAMNRQIAAEVRSFFFANNKIQFCAAPCRLSLEYRSKHDFCHWTRDQVVYGTAVFLRFAAANPLVLPSYVAFATWLESMGAQGRTAVRRLSLRDDRTIWEDFNFIRGCARFWGFLSACGNLAVLGFSVTADHVTAAEPGTYHRYLLCRDTLPRRAMRRFAEHFEQERFPGLKDLSFVYTVPEQEVLAFDVLSVGRSKRSLGGDMVRELVAYRIGELMGALERMVARVTEAKVKIKRVRGLEYRVRSCYHRLCVLCGDAYL